MPAFASNFVLFQIFGWSFILGMIALSLMFLAGYGGMVSLIQMTVAALAGYMVAILGTSGVPQISLGWPWWLLYPARDPDRDAVRNAGRRAGGAHRGHLHDHDHAGDRRGVLLLHAPELRDLQRLHRLQQRRAAAAVRRRLAPADAVLLSDARLRGAVAMRRSCLCVARAVRAGAAGRARQPAPHGGARLQRHRPSHRRLRVRERDRGGRRHPAGLAERPGRRPARPAFRR